MGFEISSLWRAPQVNRITRKARSIPILNPFDPYGRVFFFAWFGYFVGFWSWFAFPPLTTITIKEDLHLTQIDVANANIIQSVFAVVVRVLAGFACDRFGPRLTYVGILLAGAIPTGLAGAVYNAPGLIALRCFTGILGGALVPCEVWTTGFFDKNVVGAANAFAAGWANMGSGITYYAMPAIFDSLVRHQGLSSHVAWRISFLVPFILIVFVAVLMLVYGEDSPTGTWSARQRALNQQMATRDIFISPANRARQTSDVPLSDDGTELKKAGHAGPDVESAESSHENDNPPGTDKEATGRTSRNDETLVTAASWELVQRPSVARSTRAVFSLHTLQLYAIYFCSAGIELTVLAWLGAYYYHKFPYMGQTMSGDWASIFGFLNIVSRPFGGLVSDALYRPTGSLWSRKLWCHALSLAAGAFACLLGFLDPTSKAAVIGLVVGLGFFTEAANGAVFALVPHVYPASNGVISGLTSAAGTLGSVVWALIARHEGSNYQTIFWIIGVWTIGTQLLTCWIPPISKSQLGGR